VRSYQCPSVTRVELRIGEAVLGGCKTLNQNPAPVAQLAGLAGCYQPQSGSQGYEVFACKDIQS